LRASIFLEDLVKKALYKIPSDRVNTPDVEQSAAYLHQELKIEKLNLKDFTNKYLDFLADKEILKSCIYDKTIEELVGLRENFKAKNEFNLFFLSWTQGNLFLQSLKSKIFQSLVPQVALTNPSIYVALNKIKILDTLIKDLYKQSFDYFILVDDRVKNLIQARDVFKKLAPAGEYLIVQKIRPDKPSSSQATTESIVSIAGLNELEELVFQELREAKPKRSLKIALILDKDGVIFNTTKYRKILETSIPSFLKKTC